MNGASAYQNGPFNAFAGMPNPLHPTRDALLTVARKLPPAAQILAGLCELLQDVNTDLDQIANEIRMDAALAARVIRISNSVIYGGAGSVATVEDAVGRVGFSEIVRLVGTASVNRIADRELRWYQVNLNQLREALLMHGLACEVLAQRIGFDRNAAYVAGLLRGLGTMVLDRAAGDRPDAALTYDPAQFPTFHAWESERFGITSPSVTTMILDDWRFPDETVRAVELHLRPPVEVRDDAARLANLLNVAGAVSVHQGRALDGEALHWTLAPAKLAAIGLDEHDFAHAAQEVSEIFERQRQALY